MTYTQHRLFAITQLVCRIVISLIIKKNRTHLHLLVFLFLGNFLPDHDLILYRLTTTNIVKALKEIFLYYTFGHLYFYHAYGKESCYSLRLLLTLWIGNITTRVLKIHPYSPRSHRCSMLHQPGVVSVILSIQGLFEYYTDPLLGRDKLLLTLTLLEGIFGHYVVDGSGFMFDTGYKKNIKFLVVSVVGLSWGTFISLWF